MSHAFHVDDLFPLDLHDTILVGLIARLSLHTQCLIPSVLFFASIIAGVCAYSYTSSSYPGRGIKGFSSKLLHKAYQVSWRGISELKRFKH